jgi:3-isopropylmalate/(R)-2-methylmalate dehydratase large subunit
MGLSLLDKVWDIHKVGVLPDGQDQLFIGLHLIHEVTSPQAFHMLEERGLNVLLPERTFATVDHIVPTDKQTRPFDDALAEEMIVAIEKNTKSHGISFFGLKSGEQGIVHIIGPELGLTQPGMTVACGDSHTSTHGAFGAIAFGIGTSQIRDVLATQTLAMNKPKLRRIQVSGALKRGVYSKDIILRIIAELGVNGGIGYAYEYGGGAIESLDMEARLTICNMSIEGGARAGYINPDAVTFDYLKGRPFAPSGKAFEKSVGFWESIGSDSDAVYDDLFELDASDIEPMVTWGINPGQSIGISERTPMLKDVDTEYRDVAAKAYTHMEFEEHQSMEGQRIDVAFIGSCTNGRLSDFREAAKILEGKRVSSHVRALAVPGSKHVADQVEAEGLHEVLMDAGFEWRGAGCSMCLAMNPDKLTGRQLCASSSNRNFIGRQGAPGGRTLLMSPAMVAAAAVEGAVTDVRSMLN